MFKSNGLFANQKERQTREQLDGYQEENGGGGDELGDCNWHIYTLDTMHKIDN